MNNIIAITANGTQVFSHPEAHPHRMDLAVEAISKMVIPVSPSDPSDRNQTRHCEVIDLGRMIGVNHRTELAPGMRTFLMNRGDRDYPSVMTVDATPAPETRLTMVCFWLAEENHWVLFTNFEGTDDPWPEPGTVRFQRMSEEQQAAATEWHATHPLICTAEEAEQARKEGKI